MIITNIYRFPHNVLKDFPTDHKRFLVFLKIVKDRGLTLILWKRVNPLRHNPDL